MADYVGGDMIRGHIDTIILNSLIDGDKDTNQIRAEIEERAAGRFQLKQGTFYSALQRISKQGLVNEYRTTGADGVRRKFFQLTEKGKAHIEQTQSSWTMSRQVINNLIDAPQGKEDRGTVPVTAPVEVEEKLPQFDSVEKAVTPFSSLDSVADSDDLPADTFIFTSELDQEEIIEKEEEPDTREEEISALFEQPNDFEPLPPTFDDILDMVERVEEDERAQLKRDAELFKEQYDSAVFAKRPYFVEEEENNEPEAVEEQQPQESVAIQTETQVNIEPEAVQPVVSAEPEAIVIETATAPQPIIIEEQPQIQTDTVDDYLDSDDIPSVKDYKEVLSNIFANAHKQVITTEPEDDFATETTATTAEINAYQSAKSEPQEQANQPDEEVYDVLVDTLEFPIQNTNESTFDDFELNDHRRVVTKKHSSKAPRNANAIDYSDIIALSREEGFKVITSDKTNKSELGKILINRLNFHSFLIFYLLLAFETLIVGVTMNNILNFKVEAYVIFSCVLLLLPIITGVLYYMAPKRTVAEVSSFKSSFETALIITLNLILMILVCAVIIDLDFTSMKEITKMIFVPVLAFINIPLYVVIRYSLLEKQMYFS